MFMVAYYRPDYEDNSFKCLKTLLEEIAAILGTEVWRFYEPVKMSGEEDLFIAPLFMSLGLQEEE